jgi:hypothetical protein
MSGDRTTDIARVGASTPGEDELDDLLQVYRARSSAPAFWKLDVLMDLERLTDPRVLPFLLEVLVDAKEPSQVRTRIVRHLREAARVAEDRRSVAEALTGLVADRSSAELRLAAALALTDFADVGHVPSVLGELAQDPAEPPALRYCAFTSVERAGPNAEVALLMQQLSADPLLGSAAQAVLTRWQGG